jgi:hypothetical protein
MCTQSEVTKPSKRLHFFARSRNTITVHFPYVQYTAKIQTEHGNVKTESLKRSITYINFFVIIRFLQQSTQKSVQKFTNSQKNFVFFHCFSAIFKGSCDMIWKFVFLNAFQTASKQKRYFQAALIIKGL